MYHFTHTRNAKANNKLSLAIKQFILMSLYFLSSPLFSFHPTENDDDVDMAKDDWKRSEKQKFSSGIESDDWKARDEIEKKN